MTPRWRVVGYLAGAGVRRRWPSLLAVVVLVALLGGTAMGAIGAARRTQAAYPAYLASSRASDLELFVYHLSSPSGFGTPGSITRQLEALPQVAHVAATPIVFLSPHEPRGVPVPAAIAESHVNFLGSLGGAFFSVDRPAVAAGTMPDPGSLHEVVASEDAARLLGWHVGERIELDVYSIAQVDRSTAFPPPHVAPTAHVEVTLVGLVVFANQVAHDDADRYPTFVLATPAMTRRFSSIEAFPNYELSLRHGAAQVPAVESRITGLLPPGSVYAFHVTSVVEGQVERAIRPESIALGTFGAIAAVAALLLGAQSLRRQVQSRREELAVARSLGASPSTLAASAVVAPVLAVWAGALLAGAAAVAASPLAPVGAVRAIDPDPGVHADWPVVSLGVGVLVVVLCALATTFAVVEAHRVAVGSRDATQRRSSLADAAARAGLAPPVVAGLRFALERGSGRSAVPVRSALLAGVVAVTVTVATVTFASGLSTLDSHPSLYGWGWSYAIASPTGSNLPPVATALLRADRDVAGVAGFTYANAQLTTGAQVDELTVPILLASPRAAVGLPLLAGRQLHGVREVVLGAETMAELHAHLGGTVIASYGSPRDRPVYVKPTPLRVVGVATMPAIGNSGNLHTSMGIGAEIATGIEPTAFQRALRQPDPNLNGPEIDVVRLRPGTPSAAGLASLERIAREATRTMQADPNGQGATYDVLGPQRPAEIAIYQSTGASPAVLALGLALGAIAALGLALASSVRRRRRDLALLKTLGFTRRQLAAAVAWQSTVVACVGVVVGVPVGIALGRLLWTDFARAIYAVPEPTVPVAEVVAIALGAVLLANVVAALPGRLAARTPAALVLRAE